LREESAANRCGRVESGLGDAKRGIAIPPGLAWGRSECPKRAHPGMEAARSHLALVRTREKPGGEPREKAKRRSTGEAESTDAKEEGRDAP